MENSQGFKVKDLDIVYRKFSKEDFSESEFTVVENEVTPNSEGYVSDEILQVVEENINEENSVVINAATGQGKTTAVFKAIKKHFEETNDIIVVAVPLRSLVSKYAEKIRNEISDDAVATIFDLENSTNIGHFNWIISRRIHIVTVNLLLRNSGDFFEQKEIKKKYLNDFILRANQRNRKLVFFFDEIHSAIHNFTSENIFSFLKFQSITRKIYYISATYNEASLMVVRMLSNLTKFNILLINSDRKRKPKAELHLLITPKRYSGNNTMELMLILKSIITEAITSNTPLNILTYTRTLAKSFVGEGNNKLDDYVFSIFKEFNVLDKLKLHVSKPSNILSQDSTEINKNNINIGTTFNTGIDITNGTFIIVMPDSTVLGDSLGKYGIFTDGVNSIFQAIGRMRGEGKIYVVMGKTKNLIYPVRTNYAIDLELSQYHRFKNHYKSFPYESNDDSKILKKYYNKKYTKTENEINNYQILDSNRGMGLTLRYPSYLEWVMEYAQKYLTLEYLFYGKCLTPIVIWSAIHNQFHNCNLKSINLSSPRVDFNSQTLLDDCNRLINEQYLIEMGEMELEDGSVYTEIVDGFVPELYRLPDLEVFKLLKYLFNDRTIYIDGQELGKGVNVKLKSIILQIIGTRKKGIISYDRYNYLLDLVSFSKDINLLDANNYEFRNENLVVLGKELELQVEMLYQFLRTRDFIYKEYKSDNLKDQYRSILEEIVKICRLIKNEDEFISLNAFDLFRKINIGFIYKQIYTVLFNVREINPPLRGVNLDENGTRGLVLRLNGRKEYNTLSNGINSFYCPIYIESYLETPFGKVKK
ncbi:DEAD/DEAH box helicase family protein [Lutibacter sp.]|uniref:DEAD/DEAH box helicase family protein n=1 Tax=Lutibacter sp. TaxID=1925666 RepID=UPI001A32D721|nr:DEAD/DEAH box helicase family protein [Lutibacter sp.]MBI9040277.1 DEAD/DEAH box helicase family protein [Lutibacter sp.]